MISVVSWTTFSDRTLTGDAPSPPLPTNGAGLRAGDLLVGPVTRPAALCLRRRRGEEPTFPMLTGESEWGRPRGAGDGVRDRCMGLDLGRLRVGVRGGVFLGVGSSRLPGEMYLPLWEEGDGVGVFLGECLPPPPPLCSCRGGRSVSLG